MFFENGWERVRFRDIGILDSQIPVIWHYQTPKGKISRYFWKKKPGYIVAKRALGT